EGDVDLGEQVQRRGQPPRAVVHVDGDDDPLDAFRSGLSVARRSDRDRDVAAVQQLVGRGAVLDPTVGTSWRRPDDDRRRPATLCELVEAGAALAVQADVGSYVEILEGRGELGRDGVDRLAGGLLEI